MSPFLKAIGIGVLTFVTMIFLMWGISRLMNRPFFPRFQRVPAAASPTPSLPPLFPAR